MTTQAKVVFPPPPPTTNSLTSQQRNQLLRKTKKLEQILGDAPHILDGSISELMDYPHATTSTSKHKRRSISVSTPRGSVDSFSSISASSSYSSGSQLPSSIEQSSYLSSDQRSFGRSSSILRKAKLPPLPCPSPTSPSYEAWSEKRPPFLRISLSDSFPAPGELHWPTSGPSPSPKRYTLAPSADSDPEDMSPSFNLSRMGSFRKTKMDRLRKTLGHGIPIDLVFPNGQGDDMDPAFDSPSSSDSESHASEYIESVPRTARPSRASSGRIAGSRDSLTEHAMIHHAPRRSSFVKSEPDLPLLPTKPLRNCRPPAVRTSMIVHPQSARQLVAIIESPDEHGSGCSEDFGLARSHSSGSESSHKWIGAAQESEIRIWSTRRGYEGWAVPAPRKSLKRSWSFRK